MTLAAAAATRITRRRSFCPAPLSPDHLDHQEVEGREGQVPKRGDERGLVTAGADDRHSGPGEEGADHHNCRLPRIGRRFTTQSSNQAATARAPMTLSIVMRPAPWFR